jgi:hypothetical protein
VVISVSREPEASGHTFLTEADNHLTTKSSHNAEDRNRHKRNFTAYLQAEISNINTVPYLFVYKTQNDFLHKHLQIIIRDLQYKAHKIILSGNIFI